MQKRSVKIVYLINGLGSGGAEMMLYRLLKELDRNSFSPTVVALLNLSGPLKEKIEALDVPVYITGPRSKLDLLALLRLFSTLKELAPDILHTQLFAADIMGRLMGKLLKVPVVISSVRNTYYGGRGRNLLIKLTERFADRTTFVCRAAAERFSEKGIVPAEKAQVIYNGLDPSCYLQGLDRVAKQGKREELGLPGQGFLLLAVGSLSRQKGYDDLLAALSLLQEKKEAGWQLAVAGSGPLGGELRALVEELNLKQKVLFLGRRDDVPELMAAADALVLSSRWEGLPGVVLEAMAAELPVVATEVGGTPELIVDGETGFLVPAAAPQELAEALEKLFSLLPEDLQRHGQAGRCRVEAHFTVEQMVRAYQDLYFRVLPGFREG